MVKKLILISLLMILCAPICAESDKTVLDRKIDVYLRHAQLSKSKISYIIANPENGEILASKKHHDLLNPASAVKLLISATALKELGPDHRFHTLFLTDEPIDHGEVKNLWVKGDGDPFMVIERLWRTTTLLKANGIKKVKGNIILDNSYFDNFDFPGAIEIEENHRAYNPLISPLALNFNSISVVVRPSGETGLPAYIELDPPTNYVYVNNKATTSTKTNLNIDRYSSEGGDTITVKGSIAVNSEPKTFYRNISKPDYYYGQVLKELLRQNQIYAVGEISFGKAPSNTKVLLDYESKPLSLIIRDMNKYSNNFVAEQLLKHLGAVKYGAPGSTEKGIKAIKSWLDKSGVQKGYFLENASGLSRKTKISAYQLAQVMMAAYQDFTIRPEFIASLPIAGTDGTIRSRHKNASIYRDMRAKTGTLDGVSALAGFVTDKNNDTLCYVIIINDTSANLDVLHNAQDGFVKTISEYK